jgi:hypothetical protein
VLQAPVITNAEALVFFHFKRKQLRPIAAALFSLGERFQRH